MNVRGGPLWPPRDFTRSDARPGAMGRGRESGHSEETRGNATALATQKCPSIPSFALARDPPC
jgi:hypothetical protein